jgi:NitT/TauT family transport system substrate-binding protein
VKTLRSIVVLLAVLTATASAQNASAPLRIATSNFDTAAEPFYADEAGIFRRHGIRATIERGLLPDAVLRGITGGTIDVGFADGVSIISAIDRGVPIAVLAPGGMYLSSAPITVLLQAPTSHMQTGKDLEGKTVATPGRNDEARLAVKAWTDANGGDSRLIHFVTGIPVATAWRALRDHRIDAIQVSEPAQTVQKGKVKLLAPTLSAIGDRFYIGFFFTSKAWLAAHPAVARRFTAAIFETARWANAHHRESAAILVKRLHLAPAVASSMRRATYAEAFRNDWVQPVIDAGVKYRSFGPIQAGSIVGNGPSQ